MYNNLGMGGENEFDVHCNAFGSDKKEEMRRIEREVGRGGGCS